MKKFLCFLTGCIGLGSLYKPSSIAVLNYINANEELKCSTNVLNKSEDAVMDELLLKADCDRFQSDHPTLVARSFST